MAGSWKNNYRINSPALSVFSNCNKVTIPIPVATILSESFNHTDITVLQYFNIREMLVGDLQSRHRRKAIFGI